MSMTQCMFSKKLVYVLLLALPLSLAAAPESGSPVMLGSVEIVGKSYTRATTTTIGSNDLKKGSAITLTDVLQNVPGIMDSFSGGRNEQHFSLRGFGVRYVPIYIDGLQVTAPYDKSTDPGRFMLSGYDRVEVTTGYTSLTLGPNAFAGAINLVSRRPTKEYEASIDCGMTVNSGLERTSWFTGASAAGRKGNFWFKADFFSSERDFVPMSDDYKGADGSRRRNSNSDNRNVNLEVAWNPAGQDEYVLRVGIQRGAKNIPTYDGTNIMDNSGYATRFWEMPFWNRDSISLMTKTRLTDKIVLRNRIWYDGFDNEIDSYANLDHLALTTTKIKSVYEDYNAGFSSELAIEAASWYTLQPYFYLRHDNHSSYYKGQIVTESQDDTTAALGIENTFSVLESLTARAGIGISVLLPGTATKASTDGTSLTEFSDEYVLDTLTALDWQGGLYWQADADTLIHATVSQRTRFPTLKDRYSSRMGSVWPNPDIEAEKAFGAEIGITREFAKILQTRAVVFLKQCENYIELATAAIGGVYKDQYQNIGRVRIPGLEITAAGDTGLVDYAFALTWMNPDNLDSMTRPLDLPRVRLKADIGAKILSSLKLNAGWQHVGARGTQTVTMGGYQLFGLGIKWAPVDWITASAGIDNFFDIDYATVEGFSMAGREIWLRLSLRY